MEFNSLEIELIAELLEEKLLDRERALSLCEGLESKRYLTNIKIEILRLNDILNKFK